MPCDSGIRLIAQGVTDLPPPTVGDYLLFGGFFLAVGLGLAVLIFRTRGFEGVYERFPVLKKVDRSYPFERNKLSYLIGPLLLVLVGVGLILAAFLDPEAR